LNWADAPQSIFCRLTLLILGVVCSISDTAGLEPVCASIDTDYYLHHPVFKERSDSRSSLCFGPRSEVLWGTIQDGLFGEGECRRGRFPVKLWA